MTLLALTARGKLAGIRGMARGFSVADAGFMHAWRTFRFAVAASWEKMLAGMALAVFLFTLWSLSDVLGRGTVILASSVYAGSFLLLAAFPGIWESEKKDGGD